MFSVATILRTGVLFIIAVNALLTPSHFAELVLAAKSLRSSKTAKKRSKPEDPDEFFTTTSISDTGFGQHTTFSDFETPGSKRLKPEGEEKCDVESNWMDSIDSQPSFKPGKSRKSLPKARGSGKKATKKSETERKEKKKKKHKKKKNRKHRRSEDKCSSSYSDDSSPSSSDDAKNHCNCVDSDASSSDVSHAGSPQDHMRVHMQGVQNLWEAMGYYGEDVIESELYESGIDFQYEREVQVAREWYISRSSPIGSKIKDVKRLAPFLSAFAKQEGKKNPEEWGARWKSRFWTAREMYKSMKVRVDGGQYSSEYELEREIRAIANGMQPISRFNGVLKLAHSFNAVRKVKDGSGVLEDPDAVATFNLATLKRLSSFLDGDAVAQDGDIDKHRLRIVARSGEDSKNVLFTAPHSIAVRRDGYKDHLIETYTRAIAQKFAERVQGSSITWSQVEADRIKDFKVGCHPKRDTPTERAHCQGPTREKNQRLCVASSRCKWYSPDESNRDPNYLLGAAETSGDHPGYRPGLAAPVKGPNVPEVKENAWTIAQKACIDTRFPALHVDVHGMNRNNHKDASGRGRDCVVSLACTDPAVKATFKRNLKKRLVGSTSNPEGVLKKSEWLTDFDYGKLTGKWTGPNKKRKTQTQVSSEYLKVKYTVQLEMSEQLRRRLNSDASLRNSVADAIVDAWEESKSED